MLARPRAGSHGSGAPRRLRRGRGERQGAAAGTRCSGGGVGREAPPTSASAPSPPPLPPLRSEEGGDAEPSPGEEGASAARTPPPGRGSRRPEAGVSRKSSERGRTTWRTDTLNSSSARPQWETALQPPGPDWVGTLKRQGVEARPLGPEDSEVAEATFRPPAGGGECEGVVQRVPAAGSGAPGGVKRRALEALTELKWAGKPGADSSVARPSPPVPLFLVGGGTGTAGIPVPGSRTHPTEETGVRLSPPEPPAGLAGPGGAGRAGRPLLCQRAHRRGRARGGGEPPERAGSRAGGALRACVRWERASRPLPSDFAPPLPPRPSAATPESPPQPARSPRRR